MPRRAAPPVTAVHEVAAVWTKNPDGGVYYAEPRRVHLTCTCGAVIRSRRGGAAAFYNFERHVQRMAARYTEIRNTHGQSA